MVIIIISIFPILVFLKQLINLSSFSVIHFFFLISKKTSAYIIFQKLKNIDYSYIVLKTLNNINVNNFSLGDLCCEINFGKQKVWKLHEASVRKFFKDHLNQAICYLASLKAYTSKINSWETFFNSTKWLKAYETGYRSGLFQMPALFVYKKWLRLSWLRAANFSSMQIIEFPSVNQQRNVFDGIDYASM